MNLQMLLLELLIMKLFPELMKDTLLNPQIYVNIATTKQKKGVAKNSKISIEQKRK
jgi:hypothetical protein